MASNLNDKIARIRILEDLTQLEFSKMLNVTQAAYSAWETRGVVPPLEAMEKIIKLGKKYNITFTIEDVLRNAKKYAPKAGKRRGPNKPKQ